MKRWIAAFLGLSVTIGMSAGCQQKCFIAEKDFYDKHLLPAGLEDGDSAAFVQPTRDTTAAPPSVDNPSRQARPLSLQEAIAIALENGTSGQRNGLGGSVGSVDDSLSFNTGGSLNSQSDSVRVLALQPAIAGANIEASLARFDALWSSSLAYRGVDNLPGSQVAQFNEQVGSFGTGITKALASGGIANVSFETDYNFLQSNPAPFNPDTTVFSNPNYSTRLILGFEQPLLRNFGTDINQLLNRVASPSGAGTTNNPIQGIPNQAAGAFNTQQGALAAAAGQPLEGILITRLRFDQQRTEFERQMHNLLLNVEVAYWNLYQAYGKLYANEEVLRVLQKIWQDTYYRNQAGDQKASPDVLSQILGQYEEFRGERHDSLGAVLEAERNLRGLMGLPVEDGTRLVPVTPPTLAYFDPNWEVAVNDALTHRPDLVLDRENLRFHQLVLTREKNSLQPDLRFVAQYQPAGFGRQLDGSGTFTDNFGRTVPVNALQSLSSGHFNDYVVGLNLAVPLGYRFEHASVRSARLQLAQAYEALKNHEDRVKRTLTQQYQGLGKWYRLIEDRRAERRAYADSLEKKFKSVEVGRKPVDLDLLDVQRRLALALTKEYQAIGEYNNSLARLEFARGTIMQHDNVVIAESGLTPCAQVRAVEHERERTKALILRDAKRDPLAQPGLVANDFDLPEHLDPTAAPPPNLAPSPRDFVPPTPTPATTADGPGTPTLQVDEMPQLPLIPVEPTFRPESSKPSIEAIPEKDNPFSPLPTAPSGPSLAEPAPATPSNAAPPLLPSPGGVTPSQAPPFPLPEISGNKVIPVLPPASPELLPAPSLQPRPQKDRPTPPAVAPPAASAAPRQPAPLPVPEVSRSRQAPALPTAPPIQAPAVQPSAPALPAPPPIPDVVNDQ